MRNAIIYALIAGGLCACGDSGANNSEQTAANAPAPQKPKPAYCFFKDSETKGWKVSVDPGGDVVVSGKVYREDSRYKAVLAPATIDGTTAQVAPTITVNDTGFAAPANWWDVREAIPGSKAVTTVKVTCGDKLVATLDVPRKG